MYSDEQIEELERGREEWLNRGEMLVDTVLSYQFLDSRAEKFSREGFGRRLKNLKHALHRIMEIYPPNLANGSRESAQDAELFLQSFTMNVFGAIDNLAWIWAIERGITRNDGRQLY